MQLRILAVAALACSPALFAQSPPFGAKALSGSFSRHFVADLNGDGSLDVGLVDSPTVALAWAANDGSGDFSTSQPIVTSWNAVDEAVAADLDGDGDLDVLADIYPGVGVEIAWSANDGAGNFAPPQSVGTFPTSGSCNFYGRDLGAADLDGDGDLDITCLIDTSGTCDIVPAWFANDGAGNFGSAQVLDPATGGWGSDWETLGTADLDGDGDVDVYGSQAINVRYLLNDGAGNFGTPVIAASSNGTGFRPTAVDVDQDGNVDLLYTHLGYVRWAPGDGAGNFGAAQILAPNATGARDVFAADFDQDGDLDLLVEKISDESYSWWTNDGAGGYQFAVTWADNVGPNFGYHDHLTLADLDHDGDVDLVGTNANFAVGASFTRILNYREALLVGNRRILDPSVTVPRRVRTGDFNNDGDLDVVVGGSQGIQAYRNLTGPNFSTGIQVHTSSNVPNVRDMLVADLNGDGEEDIVYANTNGSDEVAYYPTSTSGGTTTWGAEVAVSSWSGLSGGAPNLYAIDAADMNGDGDVDVVSAGLTSGGGGGIFLHQNWGGTINGSFAAATQLATVIGAYVRDICLADIDGDGDQDIVGAVPNNDEVVWYKNNLPAGFGAQQVISANAPGAYAAVAADLDGDGDQDVVIAAPGASKVFWKRNGLIGGPTPFVTWGADRVLTTTTDVLRELHVADVDNDGDLDILAGAASVGGNGENAVFLFLNQGLGNFSERIELPGIEFVYDVHTGDLDGDGDLDVLTNLGSQVDWFRLQRASAATPYGVGCGNAAPLTLTPTSSAVPGQSITARITNTPTPAAFIGFGLSDVVSSSGLPLPFDLSPVGMTGCTLYQSNDIFGLPTTSAGVPFERLFALPLPSNPLLVGREAFIQAFSFAPLANPYGFLASNGVRYRLGNL